MKASIVQALRDAQRLVRAAGPYVLLEVVLPGGTLFALLLYLHRSGQLRSLADVGSLVGVALRAAGRLFDQLALAWQPAPARKAKGVKSWTTPHLLLPGR